MTANPTKKERILRLSREGASIPEITEQVETTEGYVTKVRSNADEDFGDSVADSSSDDSDTSTETDTTPDNEPSTESGDAPDDADDDSVTKPVTYENRTEKPPADDGSAEQTATGGGLGISPTKIALGGLAILAFRAITSPTPTAPQPTPGEQTVTVDSPDSNPEGPTDQTADADDSNSGYPSALEAGRGSTSDTGVSPNDGGGMS